MTFSSRSLTSTTTYNSIQVHPDGVWMEGTGQLACAWADRGARGDRDRLTAQLAQLESVRRTLGKGQRVGGSPLPAAAGVVAASSLIDTGFGSGTSRCNTSGRLPGTCWARSAATRTAPEDCADERDRAHVRAIARYFQRAVIKV